MRRNPASRVASAVLALCVHASPSPAQAPCETCDDRGVLPCATCPHEEADVLLCATAAACRRCRGALALACDDCEGSTAARAHLSRRRARSADYLQSHLDLLDEHHVSRRNVVRCRTGSFDLLFDIGRLDGSPVSDPHLQLHEFATGLEALREEIAGRLGITVPVPANPITIAVVRDDRDHRRLGRALTGLEVQGLGNLRSDGRLAAVLRQSGAEDDIGGLRRLLNHATSHLLLAASLGALDERGYGWLETGLVHWLDTELTGSCRYFCFQQRPQPAVSYWGGDLRTAARELLEAGSLPPIADLLAAEASDLDFGRHALALALVEFTLAQLPVPITGNAPAPQPRPLRHLLGASVSGMDPATALTAALGRDLESIEAALRTFVRDRYPRR